MGRKGNCAHQKPIAVTVRKVWCLCIGSLCVLQRVLSFFCICRVRTLLFWEDGHSPTHITFSWGMAWCPSLSGAGSLCPAQGTWELTELGLSRRLASFTWSTPVCLIRLSPLSQDAGPYQSSPGDSGRLQGKPMSLVWCERYLEVNANCVGNLGISLASWVERKAVLVTNRLLGSREQLMRVDWVKRRLADTW